jgi:uncharacterized protein
MKLATDLTSKIMAGETNIEKLLQNSDPKLQESAYVFCSVSADEAAPHMQQALGFFRENEGVTLILEKNFAESHGFPTTNIFRWFTLNVHSALESVGLTACFSTALALENISCNVVAGFYHDHIFVPDGDEKRALEVLESLKTIS